MKYSGPGYGRRRFWHMHGPCLACGRFWMLGWMATNLYGVCSFRCLRRSL